MIGVQGKIPVNTGVMNVEEIYFAGPDSTNVEKNNHNDNDLLSNISENNDNKEDERELQEKQKVIFS